MKKRSVDRSIVGTFARYSEVSEIRFLKLVHNYNNALMIIH